MSGAVIPGGRRNPAELVDGIDVQQDGELVVPRANTIDFIGATVQAVGSKAIVNIQGGSLSATADSNVPIGSPLYSSGANRMDLAFAGGSVTLARVAGLAAVAAVHGGDVAVITSGPIVLETSEWDALTGGSGGLAPDAIYYVSSATPGHLTATPPSDDWVTPVGYAISPTTMIVRVEYPQAG